MYAKLDPVCNISSKFYRDRDKIDEVIKYFMRHPSAITLPGCVYAAITAQPKDNFLEKNLVNFFALRKDSNQS